MDKRKQWICSWAIKRDFTQISPPTAFLCHYPSTPTCLLTRVSSWSSSHYSTGHLRVIFACEISLAGSVMKVAVFGINACHLIVEQRAAEGRAVPLGKTHPAALCSRANGGTLCYESVRTFSICWDTGIQGRFLRNAIVGWKPRIYRANFNTQLVELLHCSGI